MVKQIVILVLVSQNERKKATGQRQFSLWKKVKNKNSKIRLGMEGAVRWTTGALVGEFVGFVVVGEAVGW